MNAGFIAAIVVGCAALIPSNLRLQETLRRVYPVEAVEYLRAHPMDVGMFNDDHWGGFLILALGPQHKVFIDGRLDIYEYAGVLADYVSIARADQNTFALLRSYGISGCLLPRDNVLMGKLANSPDWEKTYENERSVIFKRKWLGSVR